VSLAFSNAFFEHLYRDQRLPHLRRSRESLQPDGACCYMGIPYVRNIATFYLEGGPGIIGPRFDLYEVYRYTHGDRAGRSPLRGGLHVLHDVCTAILATPWKSQ
jgi:hypothetical protein